MTQTDYLLILFNDTGFSTINARNAWLTARYKRKIEHLGDLSSSERHSVIERLKEIRSDQNNDRRKVG